MTKGLIHACFGKILTDFRKRKAREIKNFRKAQVNFKSFIIS